MKQTHREVKTIPEILELVDMKETREDKIAVLMQYRNMRQLQWVVNASYNFDFSGFEIPKYTPNMNPTALCQKIHNHLKRLENCVVMFQNSDFERYEKNMIIALEGVSRKESLLLVKLFTNKKINGVSKTMWKEVFPEFFRHSEDD